MSQWRYSRCPTLVLAAVFLLCLSKKGAPQAQGAEGRQWAVLIGIEKYQHVPSLRYTINDVQQLADTLKTRGGFERDCVLEITDSAEDPRHRPLRASLEAALKSWLGRVQPGDSLIVYYSGHGFRDKKDHLYLAPADFAKDRPTETGLAVTWLREQLATCRADFKLLILDACHAGSEKGDEDPAAVAARDLGEPFRSLEGVVTLASSTANEKSQIWEDRRQSLFSYWLNQGLKGHADYDVDGRVDIDELNKYVHRHVTQTAKARFPRPQTPIRIVRSGTPGVPVVLRLRPQRLRQVVLDMGEQLAEALEGHRLSRVGVLEFTNDTRAGELLGADFGLLGRWCAEELERKLVDLGEGKFSVVDRRRLQKALTEQKFAVKDLGSDEALSQLAGRTGGLPALALGTLYNRAGRVVHLRCKLLQTETGDVLGSAGGTAELNESEWGMLGRSAVIHPEDRKPMLTSPGHPIPPLATQAVNHLDRQAQRPHPLADPKFLFPMRVVIGGKERKGVLRGNDWLVPVRLGEEFEIQIDNRATHPVFMRLLVDGCNSLMQPDNAKGIQTLIVGKRVSLEVAKAWYIDPGRKSTVRGFEAPGDTMRAFRIVEAEKSLAARQQFTDQIGVITAAFYTADAGSRTVLGVAPGTEIQQKIQVVKGVRPGTLLAVVHIRYVDADELEKALMGPGR